MIGDTIRSVYLFGLGCGIVYGLCWLASLLVEAGNP
jgi:hypothetical protein